MFKAVIAARHPEFSSIRQQVCLVTSFKQKLMIYKKYLMFFCFLCLNLFLTLIWKGNASLNLI
jgi:hypothetical protein